MLVPPYLSPGDTIGITCPAGYITEKEIEPSVQEMQRWGFKVKVGATVGKKDFTYGGTDQERANDMQQMLDDVDIKAIMCARGGYGAVRIIDRLNFESFSKAPKWIIGFSDITVLHSHILSRYNIASFHAPMPDSFFGGLISFPSYHASVAVLCIWACWRIPGINLAFLAINCLMLAATPTHGSHYLVDIIGGALIAGLSVAAARQLFRRR